jgi:hypothetical protein
MVNADSVSFEWMVTESVSGASVQALAASEIDVQPSDVRPVPAHLLPDLEDAGFEPLMMIAAAAAIAYVAKAASRIARNHRQGGVVVDARGTTLKIREGVRGIDAGTLVVVSGDGTQVFKAEDEAGLLQALKSR